MVIVKLIPQSYVLLTDLQIFSNLIIAEKDKSLIVKGRNYSLNVLENERLRIDAILKNKGYFFFNPKS